ncbi:GTP cyclohydrolase I [Orenia metallireducens]|jgi:GTP cyclohydrolase I|uniref:GTP cyclohydrolase FolE2 n=1 Tax=Orenia metallireducens TaxID=1413210 RepID=A0A285GVS8_9FIRM|nr:GTP cyclohydrolase FolE2 [Orenia metallireducens]SNY27740.1 GTP cyclohydrolase I [Orenia metallireducens]
MKDVQNTKGNYKFAINKVGVNNLIHPIRIKAKSGEVVATVGDFSLAVNLSKSLKGINMSRLPQLLSELNRDRFTIEDFKEDILKVLEEIKSRMESDNAYFEVEFDYFIEKQAPVSEYSGIAPYKCRIEGSLADGEYDLILTVEVPITTLCPCSKEISNYSAHNQRGYVKTSIRYNDLIYLEDIIKLVEEVGSCEIYPILKRVDEKYVTEKAYENPRFVEDVVRLVAEELEINPKVTWFRVSSRHQESIHPHDAYAMLESWK